MQGLAETDHRVLGGAVGRAARECRLAGDRGDVDDVAAASRHHPPRGELGAGDDPAQVDVDHPLGRLRALVRQQAAEQDAGVVDEDVERAEPLLDLLEERLERVPIGDVERKAGRVGAERNRLRLREVSVEVPDRDPRPGTGGGQGGRAADPARPARDRDHHAAYLPAAGRHR